MAQLIQMRQRIKAIETIKKITHAMRLISMSMHSRLRNRAPHIEEYQKEINELFEKVSRSTSSWKSPIMHPETTTNAQSLLILVASEKGLCGNFNSNLFKFFEQSIPEQKLNNVSIITVGKNAINYTKKRNFKNILKTFEPFSSARLDFVAGSIIDIIQNAEKPFSSVTVVANTLKSFFVQQPHSTTLIPFEKSTTEQTPSTRTREPYSWEQEPHEILEDLAVQFLTARMYHLLFQSILSEQASRFISMDNATRNAKQLLEDTQLRYNKLRQAKITSELTELSASFQS